MTQRILLIEDDDALAAQVTAHLEGAGMQVTRWSDARGVDAATVGRISLVILDLMLPSGYGLDVLKSLRAVADVPVLILSARNDTLEKVRALKLGADDYMTKPFWPEELLARVSARLRRPILQQSNKLVLGALEVDQDARTVHAAGAPIEVTRVEFDLLTALLRRRGSALTRQWLVDNVLDPEREGGERTLDVHVSRLRKKLGDTCRIETVWGVGYRIGEGESA